MQINKFYNQASLLSIFPMRKLLYIERIGLNFKKEIAQIFFKTDEKYKSKKK